MHKVPMLWNEWSYYFFSKLKKAQAEGLMLVGFEEGPINFKPTYKFDKNTDNYDTRLVLDIFYGLVCLFLC